MLLPGRHRTAPLAVAELGVVPVITDWPGLILAMQHAARAVMAIALLMGAFWHLARMVLQGRLR